MSDEHTVSMSEEEVRKRLAAGENRTDFERIEQLSDEEITEAISGDPDAARPIDEAWIKAARLVTPGGEKEKISIRLDEDVLEFFRAGGRGYQGRINDVLRAYVLTQRLEADRSGSEPQRGQSRSSEERQKARGGSGETDKAP